MILRPGDPRRLGAHPVDGGVNFALFSAHATRVDLCLFSADGLVEIARASLPARSGDIWHGFAPGLAEGAVYGFRVHGPFDPGQGHLFNPAKLLLDPYARRILPPADTPGLRAHPALRGVTPEGRPDPADSATFAPKAVVIAPAPVARGPATPPRLIYEAHAKGLTMRHPDVARGGRGRYAGLADPAIVTHLQELGVTHLELLPVTAFIDDPHLVRIGLSNYWGYQPIALMAPEPRYGEGLAAAIASLAGQGIGTILDIVLNHTGEGDIHGPMVSLRGIDNASYYRIAPGGALINDTGCGNTLNLAHPAMLRLAMDALRHWVSDYGVAGFRFDLGAILGRGIDGAFHPHAAFLSALRQDPLLSQVTLIAEPWDLGPGGYQLGRFPHPFLEWNDRFRDSARRFWRGDSGQAGEFAARLGGSADLGLAGRSVNFVSAHDGFTLADLTAYAHKHNEANGEGNRDGHDHNISDNFGTEGPSDDPRIRDARAARVRAMLASLMLGQGVAMLRGGDEIGDSQQGNNNAYAQDNTLGWLDWPGADATLRDFTARAARLRGLLEGQVTWHHGHGQPIADWGDPDLRLLMARAPGGIAIFNAGGPGQAVLPPGRWQILLDSAQALAPDGAQILSGTIPVPAQAVLCLVEFTPR
ncbi:glycogen debranching protein GlgX [Paracoccus sp. p3-h83]|uniref:glycogen debranching protein GlgX n=1 Tax=Paracoccus sp. p3-h83 TaxID=3342805 RepID=UPI0035B6E9D1